jgi:hypothetical protein
MAIKSKGRGTAAAFGLLLLFAGLVGGAVLYMLSVRRPADAVDGFARAPVGCTTTLRFTETGTFYVFEDLGPVIEVPDGGCEPTADPAQTFAFDMQGPDGPVVPRADASLSYDTDDYVGNSVARVEIDVAGEYEVVVVGDDPAVVAAIGRDPDDGVDDLRQRAIAVAIIGVVLGGLLLLLAGRRSKQAAAFLAPDGPGWGPRQGGDRVMPPAESGVRSAVNPHQPDQQADVAGPLSDVNEMLARPREPKPVSPWAPPVPGQAASQPAIVDTDAEMADDAASESAVGEDPPGDPDLPTI